MCDLEKYGSFRIDLCLVDKINQINQRGLFRTLSSCCGHEKYRPTIVALSRETGIVCDYYTGAYLSTGKRKRNRYYRKDAKGFYYIPEVRRKISDKDGKNKNMSRFSNTNFY